MAADSCQECLCKCAHSSFLQLCKVCQKLPHTMMFPPPNVTVGVVFFGVTCSAISPLNMVCIIGIQTVQLCSHLTTLFSQYFTGFSRCCAANFKRAWTCLFTSHGVLRGERAYRPWRYYILFSLRRQYLLIPALFEGSPPEVRASRTTRLIILFTNLARSTRPGHMVKWLSFHVRIMAPTVLTGTFRSLGMRL